jgi:DNA polymerase-1
MIEAWRAELVEAEQQLTDITNGATLRTPAQIRRWLEDTLTDELLAGWPLTKTGKLSTARTELALHPEVAGIPELLSARRLRKLLEAFGDSLATHVNPATGRLHPSFKIAGARTGRYASSNPNVQQLPKRKFKQFRSIIKAPPGRVLVGADYSQIELRVAAELSGDAAMRHAFEHGMDIHRATAARIAGTELDAVTDNQRDLAKAQNFGLLYGIGASSFRNYAKTGYDIDMTIDDAEEARQAFFDTYPDLRDWQFATATAARKAGYTETIGGRRWHWGWRAKAPGDLDNLPPEDPRWRDMVTGFSYTYALNHPVQGAAAEIMQLAMAYVDAALRGHGAQIICTVHDELLVECDSDPATVDAVANVLDTEMTCAYLDLFPAAPTPGLVNLEIGNTWADMVRSNIGNHPTVDE